jgi:hypothetical protein
LYDALKTGGGMSPKMDIKSEEMEVFALLQSPLASEMESSQSLLWMTESRSERRAPTLQTRKIP